MPVSPVAPVPIPVSPVAPVPIPVSPVAPVPMPVSPVTPVPMPVSPVVPVSVSVAASPAPVPVAAPLADRTSWNALAWRVPSSCWTNTARTRSPSLMSSFVNDLPACTYFVLSSIANSCDWFAASFTVILSSSTLCTVTRMDSVFPCAALPVDSSVGPGVPSAAASSCATPALPARRIPATTIHLVKRIASPLVLVPGAGRTPTTCGRGGASGCRRNLGRSAPDRQGTAHRARGRLHGRGRGARGAGGAAPTGARRGSGQRPSPRTAPDRRARRSSPACRRPSSS